MSFPCAEIEKKLGYVFQNKSILRQAFTHSTYVRLHGGEDNERMEYLGDSVLQLVVTEWQYERDKRSEGVLTAARQKLVCKQALDSAIDGLDIYRYLLCEGTAYNLGDKSKSNLFEAVVAAIYLDGGFQAARKFILAHGNIDAEKGARNYKGELQEFVQARGKNLPTYSSTKEGKDHAPLFFCKVRAMGESSEGQGKSLKEAEALAASRLLWELQNKYGK